SALAMVILVWAKKYFALSFIGLSVLGAFTSNILQILLGISFLGKQSWLIAPFLLSIGLVSSLFLGIFANIFSRHSEWLKKIKTQNYTLPKTDSSLKKNTKSALWHFFIGFFLLILLFFIQNLLIKTILFAIIIFLNIISKKRINFFLAFLMILTITLFNVLSPTGKVLFSVAQLPITEFALLTGLRKALTIEGMIFLSKWMIQPDLRLPTKLGMLISWSFIIFEKLLSQSKIKKDFTPLHQQIKTFHLTNFIKKIDQHLLELEDFE
ncbi:MAG: hypothetical protein ACRC5H_10495, partial [Treponemataceae bacterium]